MPSRIPNFKRPVAYALAAALPILGVGLGTALSSVSDVMAHDTPRELSPGATIPPPLHTGSRSRKAPARQSAYILLSLSGNETTEVLGASELLGASDAFQVKTIAATHSLIRTASDLAILPDMTIDEFEKNDKTGALLVVPSSIDPSDTALISFLAKHGGDGKRPSDFRLILISGEAARLAVQTPLLAGRKATTHFIAAPDLANVNPPVQWIAGPRYVADGNVVTTAGIAATLDAVMHAIETLAGAEVAHRTAEDLHWDWNRETPDTMTQVSGWEKLSPMDLFRLFYDAGYDWDRKSIGVLLYPGVSELGIAAVVDTFPRSYTMRVSSIAAAREPIRTRHGLVIVPGHDVAHAPPIDLLIVPSRSQIHGALTENDPLDNPAIHRWVIESGATVKSFIYDAPGVSIRRSLDLITQLKGPWISERVAKLLRVPYVTAARDSLPLQLWLRPLLIGLLGLFLAWRIDARLSRMPKPVRHSN